MARNVAREDRLELQKKLDRARPDYHAAKEGLRLIQLRTAQHKDKDGRLFASYSDGYRKWRAKTGRSRLPNLMRSGKMMGRLELKKMARRVDGLHVTRIQPRTARDRRLMTYHVFGKGNNPVRDPMGLTPAEGRRALRRANQAVSRIRLTPKTQTIKLNVGIVS